MKKYILAVGMLLIVVALWALPGSPTPGNFNLLQPANGATVSLTPTLSWQASSGTTAYRLRIDTESNFAEPMIYWKNQITSTSFQVPAGVLSPGATYYWRVVAVNSYGTKVAANSPGTFKTQGPPGAFNLISPTNGAIVGSTPLLSWQSSSGATSYRLRVDTEPTFTEPLVLAQNAITSTSFQLPTGILNNSTSYYWRVVAVNSVGTTIAANSPRNFKTQGNTPPPNPTNETALDTRRRQLLQACDQKFPQYPENPNYPTPNLTLKSSAHEASYYEKALSVLGLVNVGVAPTSRIAEANKYLRTALIGKWPTATQADLIQTGPKSWDHRGKSMAVRVFALYKNWLEPDIYQEYVKRLTWLLVPAYTSGSENIKFNRNCGQFLAHEFMNQTGLQSYDSVKSWLTSHMKNVGKYGFYEWGANYNMWTIGAILNLAEFAQDSTVKKLATMLVDYFLAQQSGFHVEGKYCPVGVRKYDHSTLGYVHGQIVLHRVLYMGDASSQATACWTGTWVEWAASNYKPPSAIQPLYANSGAAESKMLIEDNRAYRCYRGTKYAVSTIQNFDPNNYNGTHNIINCFIQSAKGEKSHVVPYSNVPSKEKFRSTVHRSFGYKNIAFVHGGGFCKKEWTGTTQTNVPVRLYYDKSFSVEIIGNWAFLTDGVICVGWAPTVGSPMVDPQSAEFTNPNTGKWLRSSYAPGDIGETAVAEAGDAAMFGSYEAFKNDVLSRNPDPHWVGNEVPYIAKDSAYVKFSLNGATVNGQPFDLQSFPRAQMPGLNNFTLTNAGITFDFSNATTSGTLQRVAANKTFGAP